VGEVRSCFAAWLGKSQCSAYPVGTHLLCVSQHAPHARPGRTCQSLSRGCLVEGVAYKSRFDSSDMVADCARDFLGFRSTCRLDAKAYEVVARCFGRVFDM
jgi:hypothetical protein